MLSTKVLNAIIFSTGVFGAMLVALNVGANVAGYISFMISSSASVYLLRGDKEKRGLLYLSLVYVAINIIGLARWSM